MTGQFTLDRLTIAWCGRKHRRSSGEGRLAPEIRALMYPRAFEAVILAIDEPFLDASALKRENSTASHATVRPAERERFLVVESDQRPGFP